MTDDIAALTGQLARDPTSLVFIQLADALRKRGQLEAALTVALRGLGRYPELADAHDLVARIHSDRGQGDAAFDAWTAVLRLAPDHLGAHKGLAFLSYRAGDLDRSLRHLSRAMELAPHDRGLAATAERIRTEARALAPEPAPAARPEPGRTSGAVPAMASPAETGATLVFDHQGRVLFGSIESASGTDASDAVAAALAGVSREAERTARLLGLGVWRAIAIEGVPANYEVRSPSAETLLLVTRGRHVPAGRLSRIADRAVEQARQWLEAGE
jgi:tetratricopeptide (TPR) repeat protein